VSGGAGVVVLGPTAEVPLAAVRQAFDANVFGLLELCQVSECTICLVG
jgi:NAD(P)-dependent dehydrogenase (short-subunit alcohol dehydrogenase family)